MKRRRLRTELIRSTVLTATTTLLIFMAGSLLYLRYAMKAAVDAQLLDIGRDILAHLDQGVGPRGGDRIPLFRTLFDEHNLIRLLEAGARDGGMLFSDEGYSELLGAFREKRLEPRDSGASAPFEDPLLTLRHGGRTWRMGGFANDRASVILAADLGELEKPLWQILLAFLFALPLTVMGAAVVSRWYARRISTPIEDLANHAGHLTADNLDRRSAVRGAPAEVAELEEALNRMTERLERSFLQARRFSADASHELKTPLTVMQGILENRLQNEADGGVLSREESDQLLQSTQRLVAIVEGLLVLAKADEGSLLPAREPIDTAALLERPADDAAALAEAAGIRFEMKTGPLPPLEGDSKLLESALHNLLKNAVQHTPAGGTVRLSARLEEERLVVSVENTGTAVATDIRQSIFERFTRFSANYEGLGLGLNIAREIARAHGGTLELARSDERGTVFQLALPLPENPEPR